MLHADARTIPNGWMSNKRAPADSITRRADGLLVVRLPDGSTDLVAGHRLDLAQAQASGFMVPQRRAVAPPKPAGAAPKTSGLPRADVDGLGRVFEHIGQRLQALEDKGKANAPPPRRSASRREAAARAELALARAETLLRRAP